VARTGSARLFAALDLPEPARAKLVSWQDQALAGRDDLRAVQPEALHVTLAFLGHRPLEEIDPIAQALATAVTDLPVARLRAKGTEPVPRRRARLFALDLDDEGGRAASIQAAASHALSAGGFFEPERRAFWPHLTVARVRTPQGRSRPVALPPPCDPFDAREVVLYRSHLGGGPARYEALGRWPLGHSRGGVGPRARGQRP
jgi:2'-5' RNA ligase